MSHIDRSEEQDDTHPDHRDWIETNFTGADLDLATPGSGALTSVHQSCPDDMDPLAELPAGVENLSPDQQLAALVDTYQLDVVVGQGLMMASLGTMPENRAEWRILEQVVDDTVIAIAENDLSDLKDRETLSEQMDQHFFERLQAYQLREAQLHWACQALGWPSEWVVLFMRRNGAISYDHGPNRPAERPELQKRLRAVIHGETEMMPETDEEQEPALIGAFTPCPPELNPLEGLPAGIKTAPVAEQVAAIDQLYRPMLDQIAALEELSSGKQTERSEAMKEYIREAIDISDDGYEGVMRGLMIGLAAREREMHWATDALGLEYGSVLLYLLRKS